MWDKVWVEVLYFFTFFSFFTHRCPFVPRIFYWIYAFLSLLIFFFLSAFLWPYLHQEVPWLGVTLELQLLAIATVTAKWDPSHICDLNHSSWQQQILKSLNKARDWLCILMDTSWALPLSHNGNFMHFFFNCSFICFALCSISTLIVIVCMFVCMCVWHVHTYFYIYH